MTNEQYAELQQTLKNLETTLTQLVATVQTQTNVLQEQNKLGSELNDKIESVKVK